MIQNYKIVTLCGSTRFKEQFMEAQKRLTLEGCIVISVGLFGHSGDDEVWEPGTKEMLDNMHLRKIDLAYEIHMGHAHGVYVDAAITMARRYDNIWLETSGTSMSCQIKNAYDTVGHERVMFGIDSPFHHPTVEIQKVMACGVDESGLENIFYNNAKALMKL